MRRTLQVLITSLLLAAPLALAPSAAEAAPARYPVPYTFLAGVTAELAAPAADPPGANDWSCRPSAAHPNPVVLTHGLLGTKTTNWQTFAPLLANNGYCVYALTYGAPEVSPVAGLAPMEDSAAQLAAFVDRVLGATGATKVDILGHSEGTLMPSHYVRFLGGAAKVDRYVSLTPLWQGTNVAGLATTYQLARLLGVSPVVDGALDPACGACPELLAGSDFLTRLHAAGTFAPGVTYTNIVTRYDELVVPYTSGLATGPNITNIVLQDRCPLDLADHLAVAADPVAAQHVLNALDPAHAKTAPCRLVLPVVG